ncbi:protein NRT1/ PTR FAMILY 3.1-like [Rhodamnia argentea]|uniref:Protein NRT1/ PTR FAMILY 3.1-like n=1 Tax=Rhodamnia argentea TaxID=178133 RepID=A0A8B8MNZ9_9MYRT|nr:protein NRT1/ PTR FAMILY 3.1-like [Rhodamnia argentea]
MSVMSPKRLMKMARKWEKPASGRKRISHPGDNVEVNSSLAPEKGHFVIYESDGGHFTIPLQCFRSNIFQELFKMSKEEFGLSGDGPITMPRDAASMEYIVSFSLHYPIIHLLERFDGQRWVTSLTARPVHCWVRLRLALASGKGKKVSEMEEEGSQGRGRKKGGIVTMPFIFANEVCDKLAVVGFNLNMISYLTTQLNMPITKAANTLTNFDGAYTFTPLIGAFIADAYAGRFWTITVASISYFAGMAYLTLSAVLPQLRPPLLKDDQVCQEASGGQLAVLYASLLLTALGTGGIRPSVVAFGADQFELTDPKQSTKTWNYFNWYYFVMGVSIVVSVMVLVYIQDNIGWGWGLRIPTILMFLSLVALIGRYPLYRMVDPAGSPFTRLLQVCVASFRKRRSGTVTDSALLYENEELDAPISLGGKLVHTKHIK